MNQSHTGLPSVKYRLLSGGAWALGGKIITAFTAIAVNAMLARLLTPKAMGAYFLTFSLVQAAAIFAGLGLNHAIVRLVAESIGIEKLSRAGTAVRKVFFYGTISAFVVACILLLGLGKVIAIHLFDSLLMSKVVNLIALWVIIVSLQKLVSDTFRGFHDIRLSTIFGGLFTNFLSAILFALLWFYQGHSQLREIIILSISASSASSILAGLLLRQKVKYLKGKSVLKGSEIMNIAWPLFIATFAHFLLTQVDIWILGMFRAQEEVAIYGAAARLIAWIATPLIVTNAFLPPIIAEMHAQGKKEDLEHVIRSTAMIAGIPAFIALLIVFFWGDIILGIIYGDYYRQGALVFTMMGVGQLVNVWSGSSGMLLNMTGHQYAAMKITVSSSIVVISIALLSIKNFGILGAALAAASGIVFQNTVLVIYGHRVIGIKSYIKFSFNFKKIWDNF
jgi:O-antigen/teichoic acid export membrane protein